MKAFLDKLTAFLHADPKRAAVLGAGVCLYLAAVIITVCLALSAGEEPSPTVSIPEGAISTSRWPETALLDNIPEPEDGDIVAVYQTDRTVAVYLQNFPAQALETYLDKTGLTFEGSAPYVATADGKTVAVVYSAAEERLSITVIS